MLPALINHLWQSTLFAGGVGLLTLLLRRNGAGIRFGLWLCASVKFLVPFALLATLGSYIPRRPPDPKLIAGGARVLNTVINSIAAPMSATGHVVSAAPAAAVFGHFWPVLLAIAWACGLLTMLVCWFRGWRRIRRAVLASRPTAIEFPIPVRTSAVMQEPAVAGFVRPILLVPDGIEEWLSGKQLRAVLAHERCHVKRRDNLTAALHMAVEAVFWFHPLVWWLGTRLVAERERACDEEVLASGNQARDYAEGILRVCQNYLESPLRCAAGVGGGNLTRRVQLILSQPRQVRLSVLQTLLLAGIASAVVAGPIVGGHLAPRLAPAQDAGSLVFRNYVAVMPNGTPPSDGKDLVNAAANGNLAQVRNLLRKGTDIEFMDGAYTALTQAAQQGHEAVVQELLANGAQVEHRRSGGDTALMLAAGMGHLAVVDTLLNAGAQVNDEWAPGWTSLLMASASGHQDVVLLLLSHGAQVNRETSGGETPLLLAARGGHDRVVRLLLDSGADYRHRQFDGETALDLAAQGRQVAVVETLLQRGAGSIQ